MQISQDVQDASLCKNQPGNWYCCSDAADYSNHTIFRVTKQL